MSKKYSKEAQEAIGAKMHKMKHEGKPQAQKVAIALSEAREHGLKVPKEKKKGYHGHEGTSHEHLAKQDRRGANMAAATRTVRLQANHECYEDISKAFGPEKFAPKEAPHREVRRKESEHDKKMGPRKK